MIQKMLIFSLGENCRLRLYGSDENDFDVGEGKKICTIINTVFFEGVATLSQCGLAPMALLMLGIGFIGFRRFV
jgi:hypothetical protein